MSLPRTQSKLEVINLLYENVGYHKFMSAGSDGLTQVFAPTAPSWQLSFSEKARGIEELIPQSRRSFWVVAVPLIPTLIDAEGREFKLQNAAYMRSAESSEVHHHAWFSFGEILTEAVLGETYRAICLQHKRWIVIAQAHREKTLSSVGLCTLYTAKYVGLYRPRHRWF